MDVIVSDESVNMYGFRVLTEGIDLSAFEKNPVMLWDHARRNGKETKDVILPIGKWTNLRKENGKLIGTPEFDEGDEFAMEISRKFSKGYINAASISFPMFDAIELSEDPELMLQGQTGPTVTKSRLREISLTDIPGNYNAVKLSYEGKVLCLSGKDDPDEIRNFFQLKQTQTMKKTIIALNATKLVELPDNATDELVASGVSAVVGQLSQKDQEITTLSGKVTNLQTEVNRLKGELDTAKTAGLKDRATTMVEAALSAQKIVAGAKDAYIALASASEEGYNNTKKILDGMNGYKSAIEQIHGTTQGLSAKSKAEKVKMYDDMHKDGSLAELKASAFNEYAELYKAKFGKEPKTN